MAGRILVVGGAGYIGAHTCLALREAGHVPVVFDNLSSGHREFAQWGPFYEGDLGTDEGIALLAHAVRHHQVEAVIHFAGLIEVADSVRDPLSFYGQNVVNSFRLLQALEREDVRKLLFSSTCATYGEYLGLDRISESLGQNPINPYGRTKLAVEGMLSDVARSGRIEASVLRYFNAAGADPDGRIGEWHAKESHLIPLAVRAARDAASGAAPLTVFRSPAPTRDGTCIRDYVHVMDLASAHVAAVDRLLDGGGAVTANIGTGLGSSVLEVIQAVERAAGRAVPHTLGDPRPGDAPYLVADNSVAVRELGFAPRFGLDDIAQHAWRWHADICPSSV